MAAYPAHPARPLHPEGRPTVALSSESAVSPSFLPRLVRPAVAFRPLLLAVVALAAAWSTACTPRPTLGELDRLASGTSLTSFDQWWRGEQAAANHVSRTTIDRWVAASSARLDSAAARARRWDVSTDLCSFAPNAGPGFDFRVPCIRHDFAWRNLRRLDRQAGGGIDTRARRQAANRQFQRDLESTCARRPLVQRTACRAVAATYYRAVSVVA